MVRKRKRSPQCTPRKSRARTSGGRKRSRYSSSSALLHTSESSESPRGEEGRISLVQLPQDTALLVLSFCAPEPTSRFLCACETLSRLAPDAWRQKIRSLTGGARADGEHREGLTAAAYWNGCCRKEYDMSIKGHCNFMGTKDVLGQCVIVAKIDDQTFIAGYGGRIIKVWDVASGLCLRTFKMRAYSFGHIVGNCDRTFLTLGCGAEGNDRIVKLWDLKTGKCLRTMHNGHSDVVRGIVRVGTDTFVTWSSDKSVKQWNARSGQIATLVTQNYFFTPTHELDRLHMRSVIKLDEQRLIIVGSRRAHIWDMTEREFVDSFWIGFGRPLAVARFNEHEVVTAETDGENTTVGLWDVDSGESLVTIQAPHAGTVNVVVKIDDHSFVTGSENSTVKLWTVDASSESATCISFCGHSEGAKSIARISGTEFVTSSRDGAARLWRIPDVIAMTQDRSSDEPAG